MSKLATIQRIHSITKHPNPDVEKLECAKIKEWQVVIPKGQYSENELVIFVVIDSIVPEIPQFEFLRRQKFRVWNARFKGACSSGLVCKLSDFNLYTSGNPHFQVNEGDDITDIIGVKKYEKPIDLSVNGDAKGNFPTNLISISDEDNLLSYPEALQELIGKRIYITQKADGCLDENTVLTTDKGNKTIKDVCESNFSGLVLSYDFDEEKPVFRKISNHFIKENSNNWYEIELENGEILKVTENHQVWLPELNCYREVRFLKENDTFLIKM